MKKSVKLSVALLSVFLLSACGTPQGNTSKEEKTSSSEVIKYHYVSFVSNGGTEYEDLKVRDGNSVRLPTPTRKEYRFLGWYDNREFEGEKLGEVYTPSEDAVILYAKWELIENIYVVHFEYEGYKDIEVKESKNVITLPVVERYGYHFNGWMINGDDTLYTGEYEVTGNVTFYPSFDEVGYLYLYLNEGTDSNRLEYEKGSEVDVSTLPNPGPYNDAGYDCPFVKWTYEDGSDASGTLTVGDEPLILIAVYDHSGAPQKIRLEDLGDGSYKTTGKGIKSFYEADTFNGIWSMNLGLYKSNGGAAGIAFRMTDSHIDYAFEDPGTSYFSATVSPSGALQVGRVTRGSWSTVKTLYLADLPQDYQDKYNSLNYFVVNLAVFSSPNSFTVFLDYNVVFTYSDATVLSSEAFQGKGYGYRSSGANYYMSDMNFELGKKINLDPNGGIPFTDETYYWDKAKEVALPAASTEAPNRVFDAWWYDKACTQKVNLRDYHFTDETILYASYRTPTEHTHVDNGDGTITLPSKTLYFDQEVTYSKYIVSTDLTFIKGNGGSFGLFVRGNITSDDSYESGNSFVAIQLIPNSGDFQFSKTGGNAGNFSHQQITSVLTNTTIRSPIGATSTQYFSQSYLDKVNNANTGDKITVALKVVDTGATLDIYFDNERLFTVSNTTSLYQGLNGTAIGFKTSSKDAKFTKPVVEELQEGNIEIHLDVNGGDPLDSDVVLWNGVGAIALPVPTTSVPNRVFEGWYYDEQCTQKVDPNNFVGDSSTVLHANYRLPRSSKTTISEDDINFASKTVYLYSETDYAKYSVTTDLKFKKTSGGSFGLIVRANVTGDDSYEAGNSYVAIQLLPGNGRFQFSKTGNGSNFAHQQVTSVISGTTIKSPINLGTTYFPQTFVDKYNNASDSEEISINLKVVDLGSSLDIYFDGTKLFTVSDTTTLYQGLNGKGIGFKTSSTAVKASKPVIEEVL